MNKIKGFKNGQQNEILEDLRKIGFRKQKKWLRSFYSIQYGS